MSILFCAVVVGVFGFSTRALFRIVNDLEIYIKPFQLEGYTGDAMCHLAIIDLIRKNNNKIVDETPQYLLAGRFDYPALFHKILSYFTSSFIHRFEWLISPTIEAIHSIFVFFAAYYFLSMYTGLSDPLEWAIVIGIGFTCTPLLFRVIERATIINERCFGYIFAHFFLLFSSIYHVSHDFVFLCFASAFFFVATLSSKFSTQAMVLITLASTVISFSADYLVVLIFSITISAVMSWGYAWTLWKGLVRHSIFYRDFLAVRQKAVVLRSSRYLKLTIRNILNGDWREAIRSFRGHPVIGLIILVPWLVPFLLFTLQAFDYNESITPIGSLLVWGWASIFVTLIVATDRLKFIGEAERYMEFGLFPLLICSALISAEWVFFIWVLCFLTIFLYLLFLYSRTSKKVFVDEDTKGLIRFFKNIDEKTIICNDGRLSFPICYQTPHRALWWFANVPVGNQRERLKGYFPDGSLYPFIAPNAIRESITNHVIDFVVIDWAAVELAKKLVGEYEIGEVLSGLTTVYKNYRFEVLSIPNGMTNE